MQLTTLLKEAFERLTYNTTLGAADDGKRFEAVDVVWQTRRGKNRRGSLRERGLAAAPGSRLADFFLSFFRSFFLSFFCCFFDGFWGAKRVPKRSFLEAFLG